MDLGKRLGRQMIVGDLRLELVPLRLRAENVSIADHPSFGGQRPFPARMLEKLLGKGK